MDTPTPEYTDTKKGLRAIWRHCKPFKKELLILVILGIISAVANGFVPYITGHFFDTLIALSQGKTPLGIGSLPLWEIFLGAWALVQVIANNTDWFVDRLSSFVDAKMNLGIQVEGFSHLLHLPLSYHKNAHINGVLQKINLASWRVSSIMKTLISFAPQLLSILIGVTLAATINIRLASILIFGVFLYVVLLLKILRPITEIDSHIYRVWNDGWDAAAAAINQIESVKQATAEQHVLRATQKNLSENAFSLWYKMKLTWSNIGFFQRMIVFATQFTMFVFSVQFLSQGRLTMGELVALNGYAAMFFGPFVQLGYSWQTIQNGITSAAQAEEIFDEPEEIYSPQNAISLKHLSGDIQFENVSFAYAADQPEVLRDVDVHVHAGESIALVGESGVGKSTTISLISAYYFPTAGRVLIDGNDTRSLDLTALRKRIAVVPQEVALFNDTLLANIRYGTPQASDKDVARAASEAHIDDFIATLPQGYDTIVGERGIKLSVGQKQRVSIARAILRNPSILILDEPTSALDAKTEQTVTQALEKLMKGRTTFIIAHRLSTVRKANTILVFEKGTIAERGSHDELIAREGGIYRKLYEYQIGLH
ncbi:MAG: ABC transporter ATP-binding protein [Minisyncoccota bacterium]